MSAPLLHIEDLHAGIGTIDILTGLSLGVQPGEVHAIMGPNGSGKSTLTKVLLGHEDYEQRGGRIELDGEDISGLDVEERATRGIFVGFQYPIEVPGVNNADFLRLAYNARRSARGEDELTAEQFRPILQQAIRTVQVDESFADRDLNSGFSGGQKKRNEILQMFVLEPRLAVLDETDSGLDVDALRIVAKGIEAYRSPERGIVLITHYQRLLDLVTPDVVHILAGGRILKSGGPELARELEEQGYDALLESA